MIWARALREAWISMRLSTYAFMGVTCVNGNQSIRVVNRGLRTYNAGMSTACVTYTRVSGQDQIKKDGPERQREAHDRRAAADDYEIVGRFDDMAVSGTKALQNRVGLMAAVSFCQEHGVGVILVEKVDRLLRDAAVGLTILAEIVSRGIDIVDSSDGQKLILDNNEPMLKLWTQFKAIMAEFDKNNTVIRTRIARERIRAEKGKCEGQKFY